MTGSNHRTLENCRTFDNCSVDNSFAAVDVAAAADCEEFLKVLDTETEMERTVAGSDFDFVAGSG